MDITMGATAEKVADRYNISVDDMNDFAIHSHECAKRARDTGRFGKHYKKEVRYRCFVRKPP